jgi:hypothetical protein
MTCPVLDIYPYGTTSPIYLTVSSRSQKSPLDAKYFLTWVDRLIGRTELNDWNTEAEKTVVLNDLRRARAVFAAKQ